MKKQEIISVLYELYRITGFRMSLHDVNFVEIAAYPPKKLPLCALIHSIDGEVDKCTACDKEAFRRVEEKKETVIYKCRYGLTEAVSPLYNFGTLTGFLMMGQCAESDGAARDACNSLPILLSEDRLSELYGAIPIVPYDMLSSYVKIMTICAQYLTLSNALPSEKPTTAELAERYIHGRLSEKFSIGDICRSLGCSKSTLFTAFRQRYGTTVNAYITEARLELSKKLLTEGKSVGEVASLSGFTDQSYFSKVFSAKYGISPSEFRAEAREQNA